MKRQNTQGHPPLPTWTTRNTHTHTCICSFSKCQPRRPHALLTIFVGLQTKTSAIQQYHIHDELYHTKPSSALCIFSSLDLNFKAQPFLVRVEGLLNTSGKTLSIQSKRYTQARKGEVQVRSSSAVLCYVVSNSSHIFGHSAHLSRGKDKITISYFEVPYTVTINTPRQSSCTHVCHHHNGNTSPQCTLLDDVRYDMIWYDA